MNDSNEKDSRVCALAMAGGFASEAVTTAQCTAVHSSLVVGKYNNGGVDKGLYEQERLHCLSGDINCCWYETIDIEVSTDGGMTYHFSSHSTPR